MFRFTMEPLAGWPKFRGKDKENGGKRESLVVKRQTSGVRREAGGTEEY